MSTVSARRPDSRLGSGLAFSVAVHAGLVGLLVWWNGRPQQERPPVYRVELVGQAGPRQAGLEQGSPDPTKAADVSGAERVKEPDKVVPPPKAKTPPKAPLQKATPMPAKSKDAGAKTAAPTSAASAPKAGAGATGTKGADVANVRTEGIDFPDPGYLRNIERQLALEWKPRRVAAALVVEVRFTIKRDGSVMAIDFVRRSGDRLYDIDAMGAVEAVGNARRFGPLPAVWNDDVLVVYFTFDYALRPS